MEVRHQMTKANMPRVQFRLSQTNDQDLIDIIKPIYEDPDGDVTAEVKRLIRLGMEYEKLKQGAIIVHEPRSATLTPLQEKFIQLTKQIKQPT
jgi:hypothetical protein